MTDDLIERLRGQRLGGQPWAGPKGLFYEAANEIERLREALAQIRIDAGDAGDTDAVAFINGVLAGDADA